MWPESGSQQHVPGVWLYAKAGEPTDPVAHAQEHYCWVQAVHPAEVQDPSRLFYMADTRDYRPYADGWPGAANSDGWYVSLGNKLLLGSRHYGCSNVMYLDGQVNRDNQTHPDERWNMAYDGTAGSGVSNEWRCATFADDIPLAYIHGQSHIMPVLCAKGWEYFFNADGFAAR